MKLIKPSKVKGFIAKHLCRRRRKYYTPDQSFAPQGYSDIILNRIFEIKFSTIDSTPEAEVYLAKRLQEPQQDEEPQQD